MLTWEASGHIGNIGCHLGGPCGILLGMKQLMDVTWRLETENSDFRFWRVENQRNFLHRPKPKIAHLMGTKNIFNLDNNNKKGVEHILPNISFVQNRKVYWSSIMCDRKRTTFIPFWSVIRIRSFKSRRSCTNPKVKSKWDHAILQCAEHYHHYFN